MSRHYFISSDVFAKFPAYLRGVVIAHDIHNDNSPAALVKSLRSAEEALCARLSPENILTHPQIEAWREAYRSIGIKPSDFRPSVEALTRRVLKRDPLPTISQLVDIGNLVSIQSMVPIGAHAIDHVTQDISLRLASGEETFEPFGSDSIEHPQAGEIIFVEGNTVLTRRWTWRQAKHTLVIPETRAVEFNVDGLPPVMPAEIEKLCQEVAELVQHYCGGNVRWEILSSDHPNISLD